MNTQSLIYSTVALPTSQFEEMSKLFVIKDVNPHSGEITAFLLSSKTNKKNLDGNLYIKPDNTNQLHYPSVIQTAREFVFPADWNFKVMVGRIDDITFNTALAAQEQYKKNNSVEVLEVDNSTPSNIDALREQVNKIQSDFKADPNLFLEYIAFKAQFYNYSPRNAMMIFAQNPYATFVGSKSLYKKLGYDILEDQRGNGIEIIRPEQVEYFTRDGEMIKVTAAHRDELQKIANKEIKTFTKTYYHPADVYDISQTDCPVEDYPRVYHVGYVDAEHSKALEHMIKVAESTGIKVSSEYLTSIALNGYYNKETDTIVLNNRLKDTQALGVMNHEYAHAVLHKTSTQPKEVKEFEAECLAYQLNKKMGLPPRDGSEAYIVNYLKEAQSNPSFNLDALLKRIDKPLSMIGGKLATFAKAAVPRAKGKQQQQGKQQPSQDHSKGKKKNTSRLEQQDQGKGKTREISVSENFMENL